MKTGVKLIAYERWRQITVEEFGPDRDDKYTGGELVEAAMCYAADHFGLTYTEDGSPAGWPWDPSWFKPTPNDRIRELAKAGALIAAEIDRLLRSEG